MSETLTIKKVVTHPYFAVVCFVALCFILPRYSGVAVMVGSAVLFSVLVAVLPEQFRTRSGSMRAAACLVVATWAGAVVITALALTGVLRDGANRRPRCLGRRGGSGCSADRAPSAPSCLC